MRGSMLWTCGSLCLATLLLASSAAWAAEERLYDKEVKRLVDQVSKDIGRFIKGMDKKYRNATIRSPSGEVDIASFLDQFTSHCEEVNKKMAPDYAASAEAKRCLTDARLVQNRVEAGRELFGAEQQWQNLVPSFERLAEVYGIDFDSDLAGWEARRYGDNEVKEVAQSLGDTLKGFEKSLQQDLKRDKAMSSASRKPVLEQVKGLELLVKDLGKGVSKQAPVSHLVERLWNECEAFREAMGQYQLSGDTLATWGSVQRHVGTLAQAYRL